MLIQVIVGDAQLHSGPRIVVELVASPTRAIIVEFVFILNQYP